MTITTETLSALPLDELRALVQLAENQLFDRRCQSNLSAVGHCMAEPPHADGWHEHTQTYGQNGTPAHTGAPQPATVRWRFSDEVVALEHEHEARRRPGAN
jgi:hypothetical protein